MNPRPDKITEKQKRLLRLAADGLSEKEVARETRVSRDAVKNMKQSAFYWLGVDNITAAVAVAVRSGLIALFIALQITASTGIKTRIKTPRQYHRPPYTQSVGVYS